MESKQFLELVEAYSAVYAPREVEEELKPLPKEKMDRQSKKAYDAETAAAASGDEKETNKQMQRRIAMQNPAGRRTALQKKNEEFDVFEVVLEFLCVEGYAETLEEAEWLMANVIDEEAIEIIVGKEQLDEISQKTATRAFASRATHDFESDGADDNYTKSGKNKTDETKRRIEKKFGAAAGQHAERAAHRNIFGRGKEGFTKMPPKPTKEEFVGEAQEARNNPEKYEREQSKKYAPVRGEKTPMPPRGNKRREDFEKWYAANVR
jgi:hypothetical protein